MVAQDAARRGFRPAPAAPDDDRFVALAADLGRSSPRGPPSTTATTPSSPRTSTGCARRGYLRLAVPEELGGLGAIDAPGLLRPGRAGQGLRLDRARRQHAPLPRRSPTSTAGATARAAAEGVLRRVADDGIILMTSGGSDGIWPSATAVKRRTAATGSPAARCSAARPRSPTSSSTMAAYDDPAEGTIVLLMGIPTTSDGRRRSSRPGTPWACAPPPATTSSSTTSPSPRPRSSPAAPGARSTRRCAAPASTSRRRSPPSTSASPPPPATRRSASSASRRSGDGQPARRGPDRASARSA